ncbi:tetratricopeptide repeat protein [Oceanicella actignis]|uniref:tetratricopeptide repeat protein n=1 Tax=Oceanicella actignis TaxID=1189325 RepID=UPI0011E76D46|nr:tetratricopeptide repeat protein [Oceanicella actignis]TYO88156.1 tetratricopeptide repeat protein [Oceanicella actignis]
MAKFRALAAAAVAMAAFGAGAKFGPGAAQAQTAHGLSGAYLAARHAERLNDLEAAARYYVAAMAHDPGNQDLRVKAVTYLAAAGRLRDAALAAEELLRARPGDRLAVTVLTAEAFRDGDYDAAAELLRGEGARAFPSLLRALLLGWAETGRGRDEDARAAFAELGESGPTARLGLYHAGLARLVRGDAAGALEAFSRAAADAAQDDAPLSGNVERARAAALAALGRLDEARALIAQAAEDGRLPQAMAQADLARLDKGEAPALGVSDARQGAAEALLAAAAVLAGSEAGARAAGGFLYARLAVELDPLNEQARLLAADVLSSMNRHEMAAEMLAGIPRRSPNFTQAEILRANALARTGRVEEALTALRGLTEDRPDELSAHLALGGLLRMQKRFAEAAEAYSRAIALIDAPEPRHWSLFYERGIAYERSGQWDKAEADFLRALELQPDQPLVLNYLGYSWVEMGRNIERAREMIEKAVELRPDDGFITDSLGWVLYRLGKYEEAVPVLERAVELEPSDPILNDHFGDALWMVGRKLEARFQWKRALSLGPEEKDAERIRKKLARGLDAVLAEERAAQEGAAK